MENKIRNILFVISIICGVFIFTDSKAEQAPPLPISSCSKYLPYGMPTQKPGSILICRHGYVLSYDPKAKIPIWVAYTLNPNNVLGCVPRSNAFTTDDSLPLDARATPADYKNSGYDQGHNAPDGDMEYSSITEKESFLLSNMTPQLGGLNRETWKYLEEDVRGWVLNSNHTFWIITGPLYDLKHKTIGKNKVVVPDGYFKTLVDTSTLKSQSFLLPQKEGLGKDLSPYYVSIATVEKYTALSLILSNSIDKNTKDPMWSPTNGNYVELKRKKCD